MISRVRSVLLDVVDYLFGYDFFISYAHADGRNYPAQLRVLLRRANFKVFLDATDYVPGLALTKATRRKVGSSTVFVVIGREHALQSEWVYREVLVADELGLPVVVIDINCAVSTGEVRADLKRLLEQQEWLRIEETLDDPDASASDATLLELLRSFRYRRQETKRRNALAMTALTVALIAMAAIWGWHRAATEEERARQTADIASRAATNLAIEVSRSFRDRQGVPEAPVTAVLEEAYDATERLLAVANPMPEVSHANAVVSAELSRSYRARDRPEKAIELAENAVSRLQGLDAEQHLGARLTADLLVAVDRLGEAYRFADREIDAARVFGKANELAERWLQARSNDPERLAAAGLSQEKLGYTQLRLNDYTNARESFDKSVGFRDLLAKSDQKPEMRLALAVSYAGLADAYRWTGDSANALRYYKRSLELTQGVAKSNRGRTDWQRDLLKAHLNLAEFLFAKDTDQACRHSRQAAEIADRLPELNEDPRDLLLEIKAWVRHGECLKRLGEVDAALHVLERAYRAYDSASRNSGEWLRAGYNASSRLGKLLVEQGHFDDPLALESLGDAVAAAQRLLEAEGMSDDFDGAKLVYVVQLQAEVLHRIGRAQEAIQVLERSIERLQALGHSRAGSAVALADALGNLAWYAILGSRPERALDAANEAVALAPEEGRLLLNRAHAEMVSGQIDKARQTYKDLIGRSDRKSSLMRAIGEDFEALSNAGINVPLREEIESLVSKQSPGR
jgi:tetratricopeptide (TPR) repeat protein